MGSLTLTDLDAPPAPIRLSSAIHPSSMTFLHRGQTQAQVVSTLHRAIYNPLPRSNRYFLLVSETQVIITFAVCAYMLAKKNSLGKLWLMTRRDSPYGTFWVSNAVFMLVTTVTTYLVAWGIMALVVPIFSIVNISSLEWWWVVPLPWWPLVTGAYISIHGFAVGCSPRSPLSAINMHLAAPQQRQRRIYLPIPKRPLIVNGALILPCIIFAITSFFFVGLSGHAYYHAKSLRTVLLAPDINTLVTAVAKHGSEALNFPGADLLASDDLVFAGRKLAAAYMDVHRLVCVNLTIFAVAAFSLFVPCVIYGLPNIVSLVDHACSQHPAPLPADCTNVFRKIRFLLTEGRPISSKGRNTLSHQMQKMNLETWKMTFLAVVYMLILTVCVPSFGMLPIMIIAVSFPTEVAQGDVGNVLGLALTMVSLVSFMSCTFVASKLPDFQNDHSRNVTTLSTNAFRTLSSFDTIASLSIASFLHRGDVGSALQGRNRPEHDQNADRHRYQSRPSSEST